MKAVKAKLDRITFSKGQIVGLFLLVSGALGLVSYLGILSFRSTQMNRLAITYQMTAQVESVEDPTRFTQGKIEEGDIITGELTLSGFPEADTVRSQDGRTATFQFSDSRKARWALKLGPYQFKSNPELTRILLQVTNNHGSAPTDSVVVRSYNNIFQGPDASTYIWEDNHISLQLDDPTGQAIANTENFPKEFELSQWQQPFGLTISAGQAQRFMIRAKVSEFRLPDMNSSPSHSLAQGLRDILRDIRQIVLGSTNKNAKSVEPPAVEERASQ